MQKKQIPFYQYYDVLVDKDANKKKDANSAFRCTLAPQPQKTPSSKPCATHLTPQPTTLGSFNAASRASEKFYYRDFAQSDVEHFAQNREVPAPTLTPPPATFCMWPG